MKSKYFAGLILTLLLAVTLTVISTIQPIKANPDTIYIRADGGIDPPTANITTTDNVTYTFSDNNYDEIVVERDNIAVDGAGYTLQGADSGIGINLTGRSNITIRNMNIKEFHSGIVLVLSSNNTVSGNTMTNNTYFGIGLSLSSNSNTVSGNTITNNTKGIYLYNSSDNTIFHNNLVNNTGQAVVTTGYVKTWDNGYPSGGNYWSDYEERYPNATEIDNSGIWDTPYVIDENNIDNYPLIPEFPSWASTLPIFIVLTVAIAIYKRRLLRKPKP